MDLDIYLDNSATTPLCDEAKEAMLDKYPNLKGMYSATDDNTQVLYFRNATATFSSFTAAPEEITF